MNPDGYQVLGHEAGLLAQAALCGSVLLLFGDARRSDLHPMPDTFGLNLGSNEKLSFRIEAF